MNKNAPAGNHPRTARPDPLADCPLNAAFVAVGGKWKLTILYWLGREPHQFRQLQRRVAPCRTKCSPSSFASWRLTISCGERPAALLLRPCATR